MDIGKKGEKIFEDWMTDISWNEERSHYDMGGWDYVVDLPTEIKNREFPDKEDQHLQLLFQVKSSHDEFGNRAIKLSNMKRFVESSLPAFFIHFQLSDTGEILKATLYHVGEHLISKFYQRLIAISPDELNQLHKKRITLPKETGIVLESNTAENLKTIILDIIGERKSDYTSKKNNLRNKVGYEGNEQRADFKFEIPKEYGKDPLSYFADLSLGLTGPVKVKEFKISERRFNIERTIEHQKEGRLEILSKNDLQVQLKLKSEARGEQIIVPATLTLPLKIEIENATTPKKFKLSLPGFIFVINTEINQFNLKIDPPKHKEDFKVEDFEALGKFVFFLDSIAEKETIQLEITSNHVPLFSTKILDRIETNDFINKIGKGIYYLNEILHHSHYKRDIDTNDVLLQHSFVGLELLHKVISQNALDLKITRENNLTLSEYTHVVLVIPITIPLSKFSICSQVSIKTDVNSTREITQEGKCVINMKNGISNIENICILPNDHSQKSKHNEIFKEYWERFQMNESDDENMLVISTLFDFLD